MIAARLRRVEEELRRPEVRARIEAARAEAAAAARVLKERFGATRVRLFGSFARLDQVEDFDIDLAVEGIDPDLFVKASTAATQVVTREVDLVDPATAPPLLRRRIEQDGIDLP